jgi:DNA-binding NarL/FixJ family response regulator
MSSNLAARFQDLDPEPDVGADDAPRIGPCSLPEAANQTRAAPHLARLEQFALDYAQARGLSAREVEVFTRFVLLGKSSKEIAADLGIAYPTVKLYWTRIYRKLECDDAVAAMVGLLHAMAGSLKPRPNGV